MARCEYRHNQFKYFDTYRGNGSDRCWVTEEKALFEAEEGRKTYCIFHAPHDKKPVDPEKMPLEGRGEIQARLLRELLESWNEGNRTSDKPFSFRIPNLRCGGIDLSGYEFSGSVFFNNATFTKWANFNNATFTKWADFEKATFTGWAYFQKATFTKGAGFNNATFTKWANFNNATFTEEANFVKATFTEGADFVKATFTEGADFEEATFTEGANFNNATFTKWANFVMATFTKWANFVMATFTKVGYFQKATFTEGVNFEKATFTEWAYFDNCLFERGLEWEGIKAKQLNFRNLHLKRSGRLVNCAIGRLNYALQTGETLTINNCRPLTAEDKQLLRQAGPAAEDKTESGQAGEESEEAQYWDFTFQDCSRVVFVDSDLSRARFLGAQLHSTRFDACSWVKPTKKPWYDRTADHDEIFNSGKEKEESKDEEEKKRKEKNLKLLQSLYQRLKTNLEEERNYVQSGEFHYWEMRIRQKLYKLQGGYWGQWGQRFPLWIYRTVADFGESYSKLLIWLAASIPAVAGVVAGIENIWGGADSLIKNCPGLWGSYWIALKTVFFGIIPSGFQRGTLAEAGLTTGSQAVMVGEGLVALTLATLFVMAIRRRFRR